MEKAMNKVFMGIRVGDIVRMIHYGIGLFFTIAAVYSLFDYGYWALEMDTAFEFVVAFVWFTGIARFIRDARLEIRLMEAGRRDRKAARA